MARKLENPFCNPWDFTRKHFHMNGLCGCASRFILTICLSNATIRSAHVMAELRIMKGGWKKARNGRWRTSLLGAL